MSATEPHLPSIRMYRNGLDQDTPGGLGDCFLLTLPGKTKDDRYYVLIDCGLFVGSQDCAVRLQCTAQHILQSTSGHLHAVVLTHEHYDHLSGFQLAWDIFDQFEIDELWLSWIENPTDPKASELRLGQRARAHALREMVSQVRLGLQQQLTAKEIKEDDPKLARLESLEDLLAFRSDSQFHGRSMAEVYDLMRTKAGKVRYLEPGETWRLSESSTTRAFVLGPPRDTEFLFRSDPHGGADREVYLTGLVKRWSARNTQSKTPLDEGLLPFNTFLQKDLQGELSEFYPHYLTSETGKNLEWRKLEPDWLGLASELALKLDNDTNNTSLVLAFELEPGGRVLLFPGDAQVGNWLSWFKVPFPTIPGEKPVDARNLLSRTSVYKVGHHGSHNATLREQGLELMLSDQLVAFLPVDEAFARTRGRKGKPWLMPYADMYRVLKDKTRGRILRSDMSADHAKPENGPELEAWQEFRKQVEVDDLYFEYKL